MAQHSRNASPPLSHEPSGAFLEGPDHAVRPRAGSRPQGHRFDAELDCAELDDRMRPGRIWSSRAREVSRANIVLVSRRMCYIGRILLIAVHLIDDAPTPLMGRIVSCEYEADGLYRVDLDLVPMAPAGPHREWVAARHRR